MIQDLLFPHLTQEYVRAVCIGCIGFPLVMLMLSWAWNEVKKI